MKNMQELRDIYDYKNHRNLENKRVDGNRLDWTKVPG